MIDRQTLVVVLRSYGFLWVHPAEGQSQAETGYTTLMISTEYLNPTDSFYTKRINIFRIIHENPSKIKSGKCKDPKKNVPWKCNLFKHRHFSYLCSVYHKKVPNSPMWGGDCDYCPGTDWTAYESRMWAEFHYSPQVRCISCKENQISKENQTYGQTV